MRQIDVEREEVRKNMKAHFVEFYSPGTMFAETTQAPVSSWNVDEAMKMAEGVRERHGATPYGFCFITREREDHELDSKESKRSNFYFLGGVVLSLQEVIDRNDPNDKCLISNMKSHKHEKVVINTNSWKWVQPLRKDDVVLNFRVKKGR